MALSSLHLISLFGPMEMTVFEPEAFLSPPTLLVVSTLGGAATAAGTAFSEAATASVFAFGDWRTLLFLSYGTKDIHYFTYSILCFFQ